MKERTVYDYRNGVKVDDEWVKSRVEMVFKELRSGEENFSISTGRAMIFGQRVGKELEVYVVTNGYIEYTEEL